MEITDRHPLRTGRDHDLPQHTYRNTLRRIQVHARTPQDTRTLLMHLGRSWAVYRPGYLIAIVISWARESEAKPRAARPGDQQGTGDRR